MRVLALRLESSGRFVKATLTFQAEEMSTFASPTIPSSQLTSDQLTVLAACYPQCCKHGCYQDPHGDMDAPPQYYSSRQTLVGSPFLEQTQIPDDSNTQLTGELFYVGLPSSYSLPTLEVPLPRLPSYESVRKKDRQRQIHMMIADRFGLNGPIVTESPPSYEESIRQFVELPYNILSSSLDVSPPQRDYTNINPCYTTDSPVLCPV
ncbi:uncharacterized protein LOC124863846 isoform X2 [Girardinichthys multiradiatus]|uniref:uncharacterized protein LOC124863846 isoform X2 n=1 Tax=Girardinichthys multiradiatus TaxID=208333 RepID=UPI001FAB90FD|nr:uncharacterized protein LOC124863846 isoform X2 [Girardinichthys multiradiatus]